ncbi:ATP-grasp domain-containing protein [Streptomyces sp. BI20]|uniref:carboxylate--amine ligase n=1 Tax=Streptomyces sp. BI20 TaxID=3403460 RepID=UPI003C77B624
MHEFAGPEPAVLLRLDRNPFHHGTLGAVRSLGRGGVEVHAVVEGGGGPLARSRYLRAVHKGPDGGSDPEAPEALLSCLLGVSERIGRPAVLIAMDDCGAISLGRLAGRLDGRFRIPHQPDDLPARVADKAELASLCARWGIPHPETVVPSAAAEAGDAAWRLGLPLVAKWSRPWLLPAGSGLRSTCLVHSATEARLLWERTEEAGSRLLLQRFLPAGPDTDRFFHGCFTREGLPLLYGAGRKEHSWPVRTGLTAVGRWLPDPAVEEAGLRLARLLRYQGILDLDFRRDERGAFRLVDFNPRPGAQFRLFTEDGGLDVVRALYLDLTGQRVPAPSGGPGRRFVAENYALMSRVLGLLPVRPGQGPVPVGARGGEAGVVDGSRVTNESEGDHEIGEGGATHEVVGRPTAIGVPAQPEAARAEPAHDRGAGPRRRPPGPAGRLSGPRRGRVEYAWWAADDMAPFVAMLGAFLGRGVRKGWGVISGFPGQSRRITRAAVPTRTPHPRGEVDGTGAADSAEPDELVAR